MTIFISIVGLGLLVFVHELGHFMASLALRMHPRKFYIGFPPAVVKRTRNGIEYGIGMIPLGGFVKIPGMHRPASADVDPVFGRAIEEAPGLAGEAEPAAPLARLAATTTRPARHSRASPSSPPSSSSRSRPRAGVEKGLTDIGDALGPDAYWRARTWKRVLVIFAGPAANIMFAFVLFTGAVHDLRRQGDDDGRQRPRRRPPPQRSGSESGDKIVSINGVADDAGTTISGHDRRVDRASRSRSSSSVTAASSRSARGRRTKIDGVYRLGFVLQGEGLSPPAAAQESARVTGARVEGHRRPRSATSHGRGPQGHLEPRRHRPGLVRAAKEGTDSFLWVLGLISLSIALLNLLPFLPLDGGHIVFAIVEGIRGRRSRGSLRARLDRRDRARAAAVRDRADERHRRLS